jgi:HSP20 family protein
MLTLWNDATLLDSFDRIFDDVMRSAFGTSGAATQSQTHSQGFQPAIDLRSDDDKIVLECDVPGMTHADLEVTLENQVLTIKGHRKPAAASDKQNVLLGRAYGSFTCRYTLPEGVDGEHMTADLANGVLTISVPKLARAKPRRIQIGGGNAAKQLKE